MKDATPAPKRGAFARLLHVLQWIVFALLTLIAVAIVSDISKASLPGAPVALLYASIAAAVLLAIVHLPFAFRRLPKQAKWAAYGAIFPMMILLGTYAGQIQPVWERTPQGAKEAAERKQAEQLEAAQQAKEAENAKAEQQAKEREEAAANLDRVEQQGLAFCESIVPNVIELSKERSGPTVIEINDVKHSLTGDAEAISCTGSAITTNGDRDIDFGARRTPQGKELVTMQLR